MKALSLPLIALAFSIGLVCGDVAIAASPKLTPVSADVPAEPIADIGKKIWEGYYTAEVHHRYHLNSSNQMKLEADDSRWWGGFWLVVAFVLPVSTAAVLPENWVDSRAYKVVTALVSVPLFILGVLDLIGSTNEKAQMHEILAREWQ